MKTAALKEIFYTFLLTTALAFKIMACQDDFSGFYVGVTVSESSGNAEISSN